MRPLQYLLRYEWDWEDDPRLRFKAPNSDALSIMQYNRLRAGIPVLYLALSIIAIAAALVAKGNLLPALHFGFPGLLFLASVARFFVWIYRKREEPEAALARQMLSRTFILAILMISATSAWAISGFESGQGARSLIVPLFMALGAFASASCLATLPRAAIAILIIGLGPLSTRMILSGEIQLVATGTSLLVVAILQARLILGQFAGMSRALNLHAEFAELADTDLLTQLPNRRAFERALDATIGSGGKFFLAMLDLDGFKPVNDTHGHAVGDQLLHAVGRRLAENCRDGDLVARLGGDEFGVILQTLPNESAVLAWRERLESEIARPYQLGAIDVVISASIGTALFPRDGQSANDLIARADSFLYRAKAVRHGNVSSISGRARRSRDGADGTTVKSG